MAIFGKHIKGTGDATTDITGLWTWIQGANGTKTEGIQNTPEIFLNNNNEINNRINLGHILTTEATGVKLNKAGQFNEIYANIIHARTADLVINANSVNFNLKKALNIYATNIAEPQITLEASSGKAEAIYFNAKSDKRAKQEIEAVTASALDIIKQVQVYTFEYKNNPGERMLGVLAQEFLDKPLDDVSFVSNENATGENNDYMSIKESKLVYLLLKGMQEQQEQIELLKQKIDDLENGHYSAEYKVEDK